MAILPLVFELCPHMVIIKSLSALISLNPIVVSCDIVWLASPYFLPAVIIAREAGGRG